MFWFGFLWDFNFVPYGLFVCRIKNLEDISLIQRIFVPPETRCASSWNSRRTGTYCDPGAGFQEHQHHQPICPKTTGPRPHPGCSSCGTTGFLRGRKRRYAPDQGGPKATGHVYSRCGCCQSEADTPSPFIRIMPISAIRRTRPFQCHGDAEKEGILLTDFFIERD